MLGVQMAIAALLAASAAQAQLQRLFRADDGTAYQLLWLVSPSPGAETFRVTTLAGSTFGINSCVEDVAMMSGDPVSAVAGSRIPELPYVSAMRTFVLTPTDAVGLATFDGSGSGHLTLGSGPDALNVCSTFDDCMGHGIFETLVPLSSNEGNVPPACIAGTIDSECDNTLQRAAFAFGISSTGQPPNCNDTAQVTVDSTLCATEPLDGFTLGTGQAVVFIYGIPPTTAFDVGVAGFSITTDAVNPFGCPANTIVGATASSVGPPPFPIPTFTPTITPTATVTVTPTRVGPAAIPVIPSPFGPVGLLLVLGLAGGLVYAMRRIARAA
jgi:hypothetical protein